MQILISKNPNVEEVVINLLDAADALGLNEKTFPDLRAVDFSSKKYYDNFIFAVKKQDLVPNGNVPSSAQELKSLLTNFVYHGKSPVELPIFKKLRYQFDAYEKGKYLMGPESLLIEQRLLNAEKSKDAFNVEIFDKETILTNNIWNATEEEYKLKVNGKSIEIIPMGISPSARHNKLNKELGLNI